MAARIWHVIEEYGIPLNSPSFTHSVQYVPLEKMSSGCNATFANNLVLIYQLANNLREDCIMAYYEYISGYFSKYASGRKISPEIVMSS